MNDNKEEICYKPDILDIHYNQSLSSLSIDDPCLVSYAGIYILYGTLAQHEAAIAAYGTDSGVFCYLSHDLSKWSGPYLTVVSKDGFDSFEAPKVVFFKSRWIMFVKCRKENCDFLCTFASESPFGNFELESTTVCQGDYSIYNNSDNSLSVYLARGSELYFCEFEYKNYKLTKPKLIAEKLNSPSAPAIFKKDNDELCLILSSSKGLELLNKNEKSDSIEYKKKCLDKKLKGCKVCLLSEDSNSSNILLCCSDSKISVYQVEQNRKNIKVKDYMVNESLTEKSSSLNESKTSDKKNKVNLHIPIDSSAVAALMIALLSAGIGIILGIKGSNESKK